MRLDKFLQLSAIISRRTYAHEACSRGYVHVNGRIAKPATSISVGDRIEIKLRGRYSVYEVVDLPTQPVLKGMREQVARLLETRPLNGD